MTWPLLRAISSGKHHDRAQLGSLPTRQKQFDIVAPRLQLQVTAHVKPLATALNAIDKVLRLYIWRPEDWEYHALALWVLHTHLIDAFDWTPLLGISSPDGGYGKTQTLLLLTGLARHGAYYEKVTEPAAKRLLDAANKKHGMTVMFDQVRGRSTAWEDLFDIGTRRGAKTLSAVRAADAKDWEAETYLVFGPKAVGFISGNDALNGTNLSRAIMLDYVEKGGDRVAKSYPYDGDDPKKAPEEIRKLQAHLGTLATPERLVELRAHDTGLTPGRRNDTFRPLIAIGDLAGDKWTGRARALLEMDQSDRKPSRNLQGLIDMVAACDGMDDDDILLSSDAVARLCVMEESPWEDTRLSMHGLSKIMGRWKVRPQKNRSGKRRGYLVGAVRRAYKQQSEKR